MHRTHSRSLPSGFTLIELLVVISIIALLSSVVLASLNSARVKARNTSRNTEIAQLYSAFYMSLGSSGGFPATDGAWVCVSESCYGGWSDIPVNASVDAFLAGSIRKPSDPSDGTRGYGGFLYTDNWGSPPEYPYGYYLNWTLEPGATNCGPGGAIFSQTGNHVQCLFQIDQ